MEGPAFPVFPEGLKAISSLGPNSFLAGNETSQQQVVIHRLLEPNPEGLERLRDLPRPVVCPLLLAHHGEWALQVRPFVAGRSLNQGWVSAAETLVLARSLLEALKLAHSVGVLHCNIKPQNIIVYQESPQFAACLVDFGAANLPRDSSLGRVPVSRLLYLSPEQTGVLSAPVGERSDLYSLGLVLYQCLAGHPWFGGTTATQLVVEQLDPPHKQLAQLAPEYTHLVPWLSRLLAADPGDRFGSAQQALLALPGLGEDPTPRILPVPQLVGRHKELEQLEAELTLLAGGHGGLVCIESESGGGKSRLLDSLHQMATRRGVKMLFGRGLTPASRPLQILEGVASQLVALIDLQGSLATRLSQDLSGVIETLTEGLPVLLPAFGQPGQTRPKVGAEIDLFREQRMQEALALFLSVLGSAEQPMVIALDDCQWADQLAIKVLYRQQRLHRPQNWVLLVLSWRSEEVGHDHLLRSLRPRTHLSLPTLKPAETELLLQSLVTSPLPQQALSAASRLSGGNPLAAEEALRCLVESGALSAGPGGWKLDEAVLQAVQDSPATAASLFGRPKLQRREVLQLLTAGAVLGRSFELCAAATLAGQTGEQAQAIAEEASQRHLVQSDGAGLTFVHDKVREACLELAGPEMRGDLHRRAGLFLEQAEPSRECEIAYHFSRSGEEARALPYALRSCQQARRQNDLELAERQARIAMRAAEFATGEIRLRASEGLGEILMLRGCYADSEPFLTQAAGLAENAFDRARLEGLLGELAFKRGDASAAKSALERALSRLGAQVPKSSLGFAWGAAREVALQALHTLFPTFFLAKKRPTAEDWLAIRLHSRLAYAYWFGQGSLACVWAHLRELNRAETFPAGLELAQAYSEHGPVMSIFPWFRRGIDYAQRSLKLRQQHGDVWGQGQSLCFSAAINYAASRFQPALACSRQSERLLERAGDLWEMHTAGYHKALCRYRLGDLAGAIEDARRVHQSSLEVGDGGGAAMSLGAWAQASGGQIPKEASERTLKLINDVFTRIELIQAEGIRLLASGNPKAATQKLQEGVDSIASSGVRCAYVASVPVYLTQALRVLMQQTPDYAPGGRRAVWKRAWAASQQAFRLTRWYRNSLPHLWRERGWLEAARGRLSPARQCFERSLAEARQQRAVYEQLATRHAQGVLECMRGQPHAEERLRQTHRELAELGFRFDDQTGLCAPLAVPTSVTPALAVRFSLIQEAGGRLASAVSRSDVFQACYESARSLLGGEDCLIMELRPDGSTAAVAGTTPPGDPGPLMERALAGSTVLVANEGWLDRDWLGPIGRSALCVAFRLRGQPAGCLYAWHRGVRRLFQEDEIHMAQFLAVVTGAALENADGYSKIAALTLDLERRVEERTAQLGQSEQRIRHLMEGLHGIIWEASADFRCLYVSRGAEGILGYPLEWWLDQTEVWAHVHPEDSQHVAQIAATGLARGEDFELEYRALDRSGKVHWLRTTVTVGDQLRGLSVDITQAKELQVQVEQAQRMEAVGRLAGGLAHDFNNLLTVYRGYTDLLLKQLERDHPLRGELEQMQSATQHASSLTRQLLSFSRRQVTSPEIVNLDTLLERMRPLLSRSLRGDIGFQWTLGVADVQVRVDPAQFEQVLVNLAINARDAMPQGGTLAITTEQQAGMARISVRDTGIGMEPAIQSKIFDPFFTTKGPEEGTGLGLSTVYGIVQQMNGSISVQSQPGRGSCFRIELPIYSHAPPTLPQPSPPTCLEGKGTILVVEDDPLVRLLAERVLEFYGYHILTAENGLKGLEVLRERGDSVNLLLTDVNMPEMGGGRLAEHVRELLPALPVLFMSAHHEEEFLHQGALAARLHYIQKPFDPDDLVRKVQATLRNSAGPAVSLR
ncbi:response regulator [bacterium]|nr:response regulator [bacterium]